MKVIYSTRKTNEFIRRWYKVSKWIYVLFPLCEIADQKIDNVNIDYEY